MMIDLWLTLLPILLAMLISPARTLWVILLLHTPKRGRTAMVFMGGMVTAMMIQGVSFGFLLSVVGLTSEQRDTELLTVISILFVVAGVIMLSGAAKFVFENEDKNSSPPDIGLASSNRSRLAKLLTLASAGWWPAQNSGSSC